MHSRENPLEQKILEVKKGRIDMKNMYDAADVITLGPAQTSIQGQKPTAIVDNCNQSGLQGACEAEIEITEE